MSDPTEGTTPSGDEVPPDPEEIRDAAELQSAADLDEDELGKDPLEEGVEPPERWTPVTEARWTPRETREGLTLDERLGEEVPDSGSEPEVKPLAETRLHELDETVDERADAEVADEGGPPGETALPEEGGPPGDNGGIEDWWAGEAT